MALVYDVKYAYGTERDSILDAIDSNLTMPLSKTLRYFPILDKYEKEIVFRDNVGITMGGFRYLEVLLNSIHTIANSFTLEHMILQKRKYIEYIVKGMASKYKLKEDMVRSNTSTNSRDDIQNIMEFFNIQLVDTNLYKGKVVLATYAEFDNYNTIVGFGHSITKNTSEYSFHKDLDEEDYVQLTPPKVGITSAHLCRYLKPKGYYIDGDMPYNSDYYGRYRDINPPSVTLSIKYRYKNPYRLR